jgi:hypothetical protein
VILRISLYEIRIACSDLYHSPFRTWIHLKIYPNTDKYLWNLMVKFQLDLMVGFEVMLNSVKLNGRKSYAKIRIWPCLGRITRLNRITLCHTPIRPFFGFLGSNLNLDCGLRDHVIMRFASKSREVDLSQELFKLGY